MSKRGPAPDYHEDMQILNRRLAGETLQEVANSYGVSRERIRQRQNRALSIMPQLSDSPKGYQARRLNAMRELEPLRPFILQEFRERRQKLHRRPGFHHLSNPEAARKLWSSIRSLAVEAAHGDVEFARAYTQDETDWWFDEIARRKGRTPTQNEMQLECGLNEHCFIRGEIKSWSEYVYSRGHWPYRSNNKAFMERVLKDNYKTVKEVLGRPPDIAELETIGHYTFGTYCLHWKNYTLFLQEIGDLEIYRETHPRSHMISRRKWTDEELAQAVSDLAARMGITPTFEEVREETGVCYATFTRRFGGYTPLVLQLGLTPNSGRRKGMRYGKRST